MKSKTLQLLKKYTLTLENASGVEGDPTEQEQMEGGDTSSQTPSLGEDETVPLTSEGEDKYIKDLIDAALFAPSAEESRTLLNLQSVMELKRYKNAREEVLPFVLAIISKETQNRDLRDDLAQIDN